MALISINIKEGTLKKEDHIIGIDLGTTNSLVAIIDKATGKPKVIPGNDKEVIVPSIIYLSPNGEILIGNQAKPFLISDPVNTIFSVKRLMGKSYQDVAEKESLFSYKIIDDNTESLVKIQSGNKFYTPIELSAFILKELKQRAEKALNAKVTKAVITVPAYFNDTQRQATRDAGKLAGLDVLRIVNEPTAASLAYGLGLDQEEQRTIAVYDLGGGTFDISILRIHSGIFEVLSTHGDTHLGGDDFDKAVVNYWLDTNRELNDLNPAQLQNLRLIAEEAKKQHSTTDSFETSLNYESSNVVLKITKETFQQLIKPIVASTIESCKQAMKDSGLQNTDIDEVIMVGGSTRVELVQEEVKRFFGKTVLNDTLNPDEVVALGAAIEADILAGNRKDILLLDVTPLSLGIETLGGLMDVIIPRNSKVPQRAARQYTTSADGQSNLRISIYQGERDNVVFNRKLGEFHLTGIPGMPAGLPKIEISFMLDADGILKVSAKELRSGVEQTIDVKPQYGLTDEELEKMLLDSLQNAREDMNYRSLQEAKTEAEQLIYATTRFIEKNQTELSVFETEQTAKYIELLKKAVDKGTKDEILKAHEELNDFTKPFAERLMDKAIAMAIKGKAIGDIKKLILFLFCIILFNTAKAQNYLEGDKFRVGLKAGPSASMLFGTALTTPALYYGFTGGLYYRYKLKDGFHFQTEISPTIRGARFDNTEQFGYTKFSLFYMDATQLLMKDLKKGSHKHCFLIGAQPSVLIQSWVYNTYYQLSPAARGIALNNIDVFAVIGYQHNRKIIGIQSVIKVGLTNINRGLNIHDHAGNRLGPTKDDGTITNFSWETTISF